MKKLDFKKGDAVGPHGCVYLYEMDLRVQPSGRTKRMAMFRCGCGNEFPANVYVVNNGHTRSCGCMKIKEFIDRFKTHGLTDHPLYPIFKGIKSRCFNKNNKRYKYYGGKGVTLCDEWINDPALFVDHMLSLPHAMEDGYSIDRFPNENGNYEPSNVRWATAHQQSANKGITKTNTSGYVGVSYAKDRDKWRASIMVHEKNISIEDCDTPLAAAEARDWYIIKNGLWEYKLQVVRSG